MKPLVNCLNSGDAKRFLQSILSFIPGFGGGGFAGFAKGFGSSFKGLFDGGVPIPAGASASGGTAPAVASTATADQPAGAPVVSHNIVVHEATPATWVEITDNNIVPRIEERQRDLGEDI